MPDSGRSAGRLAVFVLVCVAAAAVLVNVWPRSAGSPDEAAAAVETPSAPDSHPMSPARPTTGGVVGLGDSVPAGTACNCTGYVELTAERLAATRGAPVRVTNLATDGETSAALLDQLRLPATRRALAGASVAIVTIGANDFDSSDIATDACGQPATCFGSQLDQLHSRLTSILSQVRAAMPNDAEVLVTGYWNVFLDGRVAAAKGSTYVANSDALTRVVNALTAAVAAATKTTYVDIYTPFKTSDDETGLLAADGDHPSATGHEAIAAALFDALS